MNEETLRLLRRGAEYIWGEIPSECQGVYHTLWEGTCPYCGSDVHRIHELDFDPVLIGWEGPGDAGWTTEACPHCSFPTRCHFDETIKFI